MEFNAYQPCPCHGEQKIKFCCGKQIVDDLNQVMALARGHQSRATLDKLDRLIAERGEKDCLLTLKTHYLILSGDIDQARECNDRFLRANPKHPIGMQYRAFMFLAENKLPEAIGALQDAMDGITGSAAPKSLGNAFREVGVELLRRGQPIAGRRHLSFARTLNPADERAAQWIVQSFRIPVRTQLLKQDLELPLGAPTRPWNKTYEQLRRRAERGQWRTSLRYIEQKLLPQFPGDAVLLRSVAILALWLANTEKSADAWEKLAGIPGISEDLAIDATMWALVLREGDLWRWLDVRHHSVPVDKIEVLLERIQGSNRFEPIDTAQFESDDEPPPKAAFAFIDRPALRSAGEIDLDRIPNAIAEIVVYGKQTDRPARIEFDAVIDGGEATWLAELQSLLGDCADWTHATSEVIGRMSEKEYRLASRWHLPSGIDRAQFAELERIANERAILEIWPRIPCKALGDQTPLDAASDPRYRLQLQALVGQFELVDQLFANDAGVFQKLRERLQLPHPARLDPRELSASTLTPLQRLRIQWDLAPDETLVAQLYYAMTAGHWQDLRAVGQEILKRPNLETKIPWENVCSLLANITRDDEESLNYMRQARRIAHAKGEPLGLWLVAELELRLKRNIADKTDELFDEIRLRHMSEPNVEMRMRRLVAMLGIGEPGNQEHPAANEVDSEAPTEEPSSLWTPQSASGAAATGKIWVPDLD